jgi:hypothetical protein
MTRSSLSSTIAIVVCLATTTVVAQQRGDLLQHNASGRSRQEAVTGYDGTYAGSMTQSAGSHLAGHGTANCVFARQALMRIEGGDVTVSYTDWAGHKIDYRGTVDPTGRINAWHANGDGSNSILAGRLGSDGFTGYLDEENCDYALAMLAPAVAAAPPTR